jgi:hypothetical protein
MDGERSSPQRRFVRHHPSSLRAAILGTLFALAALPACSGDDTGDPGGTGGGATGTADVAEAICRVACACTGEALEENCPGGEDACIAGINEELTDGNACFGELKAVYYACLAENGECHDGDEPLFNEACRSAYLDDSASC